MITMNTIWQRDSRNIYFIYKTNKFWPISKKNLAITRFATNLLEKKKKLIPKLIKTHNFNKFE